jgi:hypothetical protein
MSMSRYHRLNTEAHSRSNVLTRVGLTLSDVELHTTTCVADAVLSPFVTNRHPIRYCLRALSGYYHTAYCFRQQPIDDDGKAAERPCRRPHRGSCVGGIVRGYKGKLMKT